MKNFKIQEKEMIFESDSVLLDEEDKSILSTYKKLSIYENIGDKIQSKREYLEDQNSKISSRVDSLEESVKALDTDISELVLEVNKINQQIVDTKSKIEVNKDTIVLLKNKVAQSTEILLEYLVYIYKKGESVSDDGDIDNLKTILLSGEKIDELMNDLYFKSIIQVTGQQLIEKHRKFISTLYIKKLDLNQLENDLKILRKKGILEKNILDDKRASKQRLLDVTKGQEDLFQKYISEKLEIERDVKVKELREQIKLNNTKKKLLEKYDCEFVDTQSDLVAFDNLSSQCQDINKIIYAESRLTGVNHGNNPLDWPVAPYLGISAYYRDDEYTEHFGTDHDAIDIVVQQGTDIKAPMDGYVIYIQPPINTGYAYIALKHSDTLVTLYGHISSSEVGLYDFVKKGDIFAKSGGEYGTNGAGILTTGPHLHFVVYENEEYADPLEYLDTSYIAYNKLPEKYSFKYLSDFKIRKGYEYTGKKTTGGNVFRIEGENEVERQKYLLDTYAVGDFVDWDIWIEESVAENIDPTFLMCIGLAETTLGKYLKTPYNIGNVGNTDSGSTYSFSSAREGVHWMAITFNNRYLSQYSEIDELSRYGNKDESKPIYASSDFNWHNNIIKCMSHVKGHFIPDNYQFRLK
ncbi:peptidoglycan DD-metalloendopeptidase family protein [Candidatus Gracilibacteria bacterium]|nr:peptidoglycan DD-metalloendopeptidase family protein [Candidatus Gracilibacteria bacterium]